jgi:hypothetical protein
MKLTPEEVAAMTLENIRSLSINPDSDGVGWGLDGYRVMFDRLGQLNPELAKIVTDARPNLMSKLGSPVAFVNAVSVLSLIEKLYVWSHLTSKGIDEIDFAKAVHKHMAHMIIEAFSQSQQPVQPPSGD